MAAKGAGSSEQYELLVAKLREIFQIDRQDLDFGMYRILNARSNEINDYLSTGLQAKVQESLAKSSAAEIESLQADHSRAEKAAVEAGIDPGASPTVVQLGKRIAEARKGKVEYETRIFSHLLAFFSRYYDSGDFISQRRYKGDTYAIPYDGQEVMMYWANQDQYYVKSAETFSNFSFKVSNNRTVTFSLAKADTDKDNRQDRSDARRFVFLRGSRTIFSQDAEGNPVEKTIDPISENGEELTIRFDYIPCPSATRQDALNKEAVQQILENKLIKQKWQVLAKGMPTEKNSERTLLEKHLSIYTHKNDSDYFIHKDLERFLLRELDFYIKNEVMLLDDLGSEDASAHLEKQFLIMKCLRSIAVDIIAFLGAIENFQKKLWLKKKFVISSEYCMTLGRVPSDMYEAIVKNNDQWREWHALGLRESPSPGTVKDLEENKNLMVDTGLFDRDFKLQLLEAQESIDEQIDGIIVHGDNFQALNLLKEKYNEEVDIIYIDPPYNTDHSQIIYKNQFKHSSWLSLIANTLPLASSLAKEKFSFGFAIDDYEHVNAASLLRQHFYDCELSTVVIQHHAAGAGGRLSRTHEYYMAVSPPSAGNYQGAPKEDEEEDRYFMRTGRGEQNFRKRSNGKGRWKSFYALLINPETSKVVGAEPPPARDDDSYPTEPTEEGLIRKYPISASGEEERVWRRSYEEGVKLALAGALHYTGKAVIHKIERKNERAVVRSVWCGAEHYAGGHGTNLLRDLNLNDKFDYPKSVKTIEQCLWMQSFGKRDFTALDYFAGSGTTAHAIINLNRQDGGKRKYILVEQGDYLNHVIKPRIKKIIYAPNWKKGKPAPPPCR